MIFQFGDFYDQASTFSEWGIAIFNSLVVVGVFFLGLRFTQINDKKNSDKAGKELRQFVYYAIASLEKPFNIQIKAIDEIINQINKDDLRGYKNPQVPSFNVKRILNFPQEELFKSFVIKLSGDTETKTKNFYKLLNSLEYFDNVINKSLPELFDNFIISVNNLNDSYKKNADHIFELLRYHMYESNPDKIANDFRAIGDNYSLEVRKNNGPIGPFFTYNNAILPLIEFCDKNISDRRCKEMSTPLINCKTAILIFQNNRDFFITQYSELANTMNEIKNGLDGSIIELKNMEYGT